jgi:hypothetical protein
VGLFVGAGVCFFCFFFSLLLIAARRGRRVKEDKQEESLESQVPLDKNEAYQKSDALNPYPPSPPPGILHTNNSRRQGGLYLPDQENSTHGGTSIGDPEFTHVSSVDMASTDDGSESFVDQTRSLNMAISKDMLGGASEVPKNRNPLISRMGASLTPHLVLSSSSDDGDSPPVPPTRKMVGGFYRLDDDDEESSDDDVLVQGGDDARHQAQEFTPDTLWNPDDTEEDGDDVEKGSVFSDEPSSSSSGSQKQQLPVPPELKDSPRRKARKANSRSILSGSMAGL